MAGQRRSRWSAIDTQLSHHQMPAKYNLPSQAHFESLIPIKFVLNFSPLAIHCWNYENWNDNKINSPNVIAELT